MSDVIKLVGTLNSPATWLPDKNIMVLLDTGATMPVWSSTLEDLYETFHAIDKFDMKCCINGFGGYKKLGDVYLIPKLVLGVHNGIIINNLPVVFLPDEKSRYDLILSNTVFAKYRVIFDNQKHMCYIDTKDRELYCNPVYNRLGNAITRANAFVNESEV